VRNEDVGPTANNNRNQMETALRMLNFYASRLQFVGVLILVSTLVNIIVVLFGFATIPAYTSNHSINYSDVRDKYTLIVVAIFAFVVISSVIFDQLRRLGSVLFEEISDDLEWHIDAERRTLDTLRVKESKNAPPLTVRLTLRHFAQSSELPLITGRQGLILYILLNLFVSIAELVSIRVYYP